MSDYLDAFIYLVYFIVLIVREFEGDGDSIYGLSIHKLLTKELDLKISIWKNIVAILDIKNPTIKIQYS